MQATLQILLFGVGMLAGGFIIGYAIVGKNIPAEQLATIAIIIAILTWFGSGTDYLGFINQYYTERKQKKQAMVDTVKGHTKNIINEIKVERGGGASKEVRFSRHKIRFLQHVYTSERDLFDQMEDTTQAGEMNKGFVQSLNQKLVDEINSSENLKSDPSQTTFFVSSAVEKMLVNVGTSEWKAFISEEKSTLGFYYVSLPSISYSLTYSNKQFADKMAQKLNNLVTDTEMCHTITQYRSNTNLDAECLEKIDELFSAVSTDGHALLGACKSCIKNYERKEIERFEKDFKELENTEIYRTWIKA